MYIYMDGRLDKQKNAKDLTREEICSSVCRANKKKKQQLIHSSW